jgi:CRP-like cAMP-binding protein
MDHEEVTVRNAASCLQSFEETYGYGFLDFASKTTGMESSEHQHFDPDILLQVRAFSGTSNAMRRTLCHVSRTLNFDIGDFVFRRGDSGDLCLLVLTGIIGFQHGHQATTVSRETSAASGDAPSFRLLPGNAFGASALDPSALDPVPRASDAIALEPSTRILAIARADFLTVLRASQAAEILDALLSGDASDAALSMLRRRVISACADSKGVLSSLSLSAQLRLCAAMSARYWPDAGACVFRAGDPVDYPAVSCAVCFHPHLPRLLFSLARSFPFPSSFSLSD